MKQIFNFIFFFSTLISFSQEMQQKYLYEYISYQQGLSHNYVSKVVSDSLNVKWIATENGITKYDGTSFSYIQPGSKYPELTNENIETLFVDSRNNLWIGTKTAGLAHLDIKKHILTSYNHILSKNKNDSFRIKAFEEDDNGHIWVGTQENGIFVIDPVSSKLSKHLETNAIRFLKKDKEGIIWYGQNWNINNYNPKTKEAKTYYLGFYPSTFLEDVDRNCFWLGTVDNHNPHALYKLDKSNYKISKIKTGISASFTSTLFLDDDNQIWIGTWGQGLYVSNNEVNAFKKMDLVYPSNTKKSTNYDIILDIHKDKNDVIWISSDFGGIVKLSKNKGFYNLNGFVSNPILKEGINIQSIHQTKNNVYLGSLRSGLFYGEDISKMKQYPYWKNNKIYAVYEYNNMVLVGNKNQVIFSDFKHHIIKKFNIAQATAFLPIYKNRMWIGTQQSGIFLVNSNDKMPNKKYRRYHTKNEKYRLNSNRVTSIIKDANYNFWIGTYNGLHLYNKKSEQFIHFSELLDEKLPNIVNVLFSDSNYLWLGTPDGLYKLHFENNRLKILGKYNKEINGLENDFICGITNDPNGFLWLSTATNLIRFNPYDDSFVNFGRNEGVRTELFNQRTLVRTKNGSQIFAGGTDNLTFFNPKEIQPTPPIKQLLFSNLKIENKNVTAGEIVHNYTVLSKDFSYTSNIDISHTIKSFSISFGTTNFNENSHLNYRYKLEGLDTKWNDLKSKNEINFIGLPAGKYNLKVAASSNFKDWSLPVTMSINVKYAPWASPFAYFLYLLISLSIFAGFVFIIMKQYRLKDKLSKEQELSEAKFTFFTNISHEFRTPLTLILSPLKELILRKDLQADLTDSLVTMEKNADRLLNLITQLLDFRKAEHGLLQLSASNGNFAKFSEEVFLYFKEQARSKDIKYTFQTSKKEIQFPFDRNKMEIVLCNLISNSLKYSNKGDAIQLYISQENNECIISIKDTGIGMTKDAANKIFDRFYQIKSTNTSNILGSGIGLSFTKKIIELHNGSIDVVSKLHKGTEFMIRIPLTAENTAKLQSVTSEEIKRYKSIDELKNLQVGSKENTVLVVDDNDDIRNYLNQLLKTEYNILTAKDGVEAVEIASSEIPDLILCDIMMPRKDGLAVSSELKSQITTSHIPIILLTARSSNMYEIQGLETGADDFITKPFDPQVVKARISSALQNRTKIREYFSNKVRFQPSSTESETQNPEDIFIEKAILLVETNLNNEDFNIKMMQDKLFMSQSSLYRKIKSLTGLSLTGFIRSIRLKKAAELILTTNDKLSVVSLHVGFNDYKYFRESFKKQFGCLPSDYRDEKSS